MTDEQLEKEVQNLNESLEKLANSASLTKAEKKHRNFLLLKKEALLRIKEAREKNDKSKEFESIAAYGLLTSYGEKNPILMRLARSKFGIGL